ncbi:hypothetical protein PMIT1313_01868 [Prochlorococcus marinus str. MIT 1313]|nr:hypothetical protein PMIT1313_01868 [Prochlorococcus marinus str. MIT 1313]KZR71505.1 hypothetical protein PMIT1318_02658 [Prochlorococcus marinus str. MIT 1318]
MLLTVLILSMKDNSQVLISLILQQQTQPKDSFKYKFKDSKLNENAWHLYEQINLGKL